jgi:hypothetical protein
MHEIESHPAVKLHSSAIRPPVPQVVSGVIQTGNPPNQFCSVWLGNEAEIQSRNRTVIALIATNVLFEFLLLTDDPGVEVFGVSHGPLPTGSRL